MSGDRLRVVMCPDAFKGTATSVDAARALAEGWRSARPHDDVIELPLGDGGDGTIDAIAAARPDSRRHSIELTGPVGASVRADWLELPGGPAVIELARCCGLARLAAPAAMQANTVGLGECIRAAVAAGCHDVLVGLGGSASTDAGLGALVGLGAVARDAAGEPVRPCGGSLSRISQVSRPGIDATVTCLTDVAIPLFGPDGAAYRFGPQKGADVEQVRELDAGLRHIASVLGGDPDAPGCGAAGGTGYGLATGIGARLTPGAAAVADLAGLPAALANADAVITGEGRFDETSRLGKTVGHVLDVAPDAARVHVVAGDLVGAPPDGLAVTTLAALAGSSSNAAANAARWLVEAGRMLAEQWE